MSQNETRIPPVVWRQTDGTAVGCDEKIRILNDNLEEIRSVCQDAFEDAMLMGCDEVQVRGAFAEIIARLVNPYASRQR